MQHCPRRWAGLLLGLKEAARPDRVWVAAYWDFARHPGGRAEYREFLGIHHGWMAALDRRLVEAGEAQVLMFPGHPMHFTAPLHPDRLRAGVAAGMATALVCIPQLERRSQALGYLYVYESFRLGSRAIARQVRRLGIAPGKGTAGVERVGPGTRRDWLSMLEALASVPPHDHGAVVKSARQILLLWGEWLRSPQARLGQPVPPRAKNGIDQPRNPHVLERC